MSEVVTLEALIDACQATVARCFDCLDASLEPGETVLSEVTDAFQGLEALLNLLDAVELDLRAERTEDPTSATEREHVRGASEALDSALELLARSEAAGVRAALSEVTHQGRTIYRSVVPLLFACVGKLQTTSSPNREGYACELEIFEPNPFGSG